MTARCPLTPCCDSPIEQGQGDGATQGNCRDCDFEICTQCAGWFEWDVGGCAMQCRACRAVDILERAMNDNVSDARVRAFILDNDKMKR